MNECGNCPFDEQNCDDCELPEFTNDKYRDTCDVCYDLIMIPYDTRDRYNLVVCKECSKKPAQEIYEEFCDSVHGENAIGTFEGVYVEGTDRWWGL